MTSILFWNCYSAWKAKVGHFLRDYVLRFDISIIGLMETKVDQLSRVEIDRMVGRNWDFIHQPAEGKSGGIAVLWRRDVALFVPSTLTTQCVLGLDSLPDGVSWQVGLCSLTRIRTFAGSFGLCSRLT